MKKVLFTLFSLVLLSALSNAQTTWQAPWIEDTASLGAGVTQDVFYSMTNGTMREENNKNWHLAFAMNAIGDSAAIWANHQSGNAYTRVYNIHKPASQFSAVAISDTTNAPQLFNNDKGWFNGAFNNINSTNVFNFGWGTYNTSNHRVFGDSVFIVQTTTDLYKFVIDSLNGYTNDYYFRVENLTTPAPVSSLIIMKSPNYTNRLFAYFNLAMLSDTNREPVNATWDLLFNRYTTDAVGSGQGTNNNVIGVLSNKGVKCAKASVVHVDTAYDNRNNYTLDSTISTIGYNWKTFDGTGWSIPDSVSYFILDKNSNLWQLQFLNYTGTPTGDIYFRKRMVWPLSVNNLPASINQIAVVPNPAQENINLVVDAKQNDAANILITDISGKIVLKTAVKLNTGMNAYTLPSAQLHNGTYILSLQGKGWNVNEKIMIAK